MKKIFIIPFLIFASFLMFLYVVLPQISKTNEAKDNFLTAEKEFAIRQQYFAGLKNSLEELSAYGDTLEKIEASLPGEISLSSLIDFFNQKADSNGLILSSLTPIAGPAITQVAQSAQQSAQQSTQQSVEVGLEVMSQVKEAPAQHFSLALEGSVVSFESFLKDIDDL